MARAFVPHTITSDSALGGSVIDHDIRLIVVIILILVELQVMLVIEKFGLIVFG